MIRFSPYDIVRQDKDQGSTPHIPSPWWQSSPTKSTNLTAFPVKPG